MDDLVWDLTEFSHESNDFWDNGQVLIKGDPFENIAQVVIEATKGDSDEGYVAVDSLFFVSDYEECETKPSDAITTNYVNIDNSTDIFGELHGDGDGPEHDHADDNFIHM